MDGWIDRPAMSVGSTQRTSLVSEPSERGFAVGDAGVEADGELLADFAVVVGYDVAGVGVDADQSGQLDGEAGFLGDFADGGGETYGAGCPRTRWRSTTWRACKPADSGPTT